jgi:hypothetical protein
MPWNGMKWFEEEREERRENNSSNNVRKFILKAHSILFFFFPFEFFILFSFASFVRFKRRFLLYETLDEEVRQENVVLNSYKI